MNERRFTGFADRNGKKIYEDDVLFWRNDDGDIMFNKVYFKDGCYFVNTGIGEDILLAELLKLDAEVRD